MQGRRWYRVGEKGWLRGGEASLYSSAVNNARPPCAPRISFTILAIVDARSSPRTRRLQLRAPYTIWQITPADSEYCRGSQSPHWLDIRPSNWLSVVPLSLTLSQRLNEMRHTPTKQARRACDTSSRHPATHYGQKAIVQPTVKLLSDVILYPKVQKSKQIIEHVVSLLCCPCCYHLLLARDGCLDTLLAEWFDI